MKILSVSSDAELAQLRLFALVHGGHDVVSVTSEKEALEVVAGVTDFDVVLLCHSLPSGTARQIARIMQQRKSTASTIYIVHIYGEWPEIEADRYVVGADGPDVILRLLEEMKRSK